MSFKRFPNYLPASDLPYHQADDWAKERAALANQGARLLGWEEANALGLGDAILIGSVALPNGATLYKPQPAEGLSTCNLPYTVAQQAKITPEGQAKTYAQLVEDYVAKTFEPIKYLCTLDPGRCCVVAHENFTYELLLSISNPHQTIPIALVDKSMKRVIFFEFELPIQRLCDQEPARLGGQVFKRWNQGFEAFMAQSSTHTSEAQHVVQVVKALTKTQRLS